MRRLHLLEIEDQPWCPRAVRDGATDYLQHVVALTKPYAPIVERLCQALRRPGARSVIDLCSGGGGPWPWLQPALTAEGVEVSVYLTDRYPNLEAFHQAKSRSKGQVRFSPDSVDASHVPGDFRGFRTLFTSFHHFRPAEARAILRDAVAAGEGIGVFEVTQRSAKALLLTALSPLIVLLITPMVRPFRWSRLFWTYLVPLIPAVVLFDGLVSCLRTYTPAELREMIADLGQTGYEWQIGEEYGEKSPVPVTYLIGYPAKPTG
jgi:hypothetical protein